jgi:hypothetical protein
MMPAMQQRLLIAGMVVAASLLWLWPAPFLSGPDGNSGIALTSSSAGLAMSLLLVLLASVPVMLLALIPAAAGHPLAGVFVMSGSLAVLAALGGSPSGWLRRAQLPDEYVWLMGETLIWGLWLVLGITVLQRLRPVLRERMGFLRSDHWGDDQTLAMPLPSLVPGVLVCALVSGTLAQFLVRTADSGQVIGSLIVAFAAGSGVAQMLFPARRVTGLLLAPLLVAVASYAWVVSQYDRPEHVLSAWYSMSDAWTQGQRLLGPAVCLPIHYASAAVMGCTIGIGIAQGMDAARAQALATEQ